jgi:hypothetical protein
VQHLRDFGQNNPHNNDRAVRVSISELLEIKPKVLVVVELNIGDQRFAYVYRMKDASRPILFGGST